MIYKNLFISLFAAEEKVFAAVMNLHGKNFSFVWFILRLDFGIPGPKPTEKEHFSCLHLLKTKPDIIFKVEK